MGKMNISIFLTNHSLSNTYVGNERGKGVSSVEKVLTWEELKRVANLAKKKEIKKANPIIIPHNCKYDRITMAKRKTRERLGIWVY